MKLVIAARAETDLAEIWAYIAADNVGAADRFVDELYACCLNLGDFPGMGRPRDELVTGLRSLPFRRYVIFYRVASETVEIVRVLSGYRDLEAQF